MTPIPIERSHGLEFAESVLIAELSKLNLRCEIETAGQYVRACRCLIIDEANGEVLAAGNGKGELEAARVGSLFEAAEHLFSRYNYIDSTKIKQICVSQFHCLKGCNDLPLAIVTSEANKYVPSLEYDSLGGGDRCYYPLALSCPSYIDLLCKNTDGTLSDSFDYRRLEHYSSNSGTAIGMNVEEALVHGFLENIERYSLSKFLADNFLFKSGNPLQVLDQDSLTGKVREILFRVKSELRRPVVILSMPNKFGIPVYLSWMDQDEFAVGIAGFGCSLSAEHAILRSLYEVVQYYLVGNCFFGNEWLHRLDEETLGPLDGFPAHQACAKFDVRSKIDEVGCDVINYRDLAELQFNPAPKEYLAQLIQIIRSHGEVPFASKMNSIGDEITIAHTFISGEDRFFNVRSGKLVFPNRNLV